MELAILGAWIAAFCHGGDGNRRRAGESILLYDVYLVLIGFVAEFADLDIMCNMYCTNINVVY